jgi:hypothetical protein
MLGRCARLIFAAHSSGGRSDLERHAHFGNSAAPVEMLRARAAPRRSARRCIRRRRSTGAAAISTHSLYARGLACRSEAGALRAQAPVRGLSRRDGRWAMMSAAPVSPPTTW